MSAYRLTYVATLALLAGIAACSSPPAPPGAAATATNVVRAAFACDGGKTIQATFRNSGPGSVDLVLSDGRSFSLPQTPSGSGARYAASDERIVFWSKGNTAFIEEAGAMTYKECIERH